MGPKKKFFYARLEPVSQAFAKINGPQRPTLTARSGVPDRKKLRQVHQSHRTARAGE